MHTTYTSSILYFCVFSSYTLIVKGGNKKTRQIEVSEISMKCIAFFHVHKTIPERDYAIYANQTVIDHLNTCASFRLTGWFIYLPHKNPLIKDVKIYASLKTCSIYKKAIEHHKLWFL